MKSKMADIRLTWFGHNCFLFSFNRTNILIDPFFEASLSLKDKRQLKLDYILVSHGHEDHLTDALPLSLQSNAPLITNFELGNFFEKKGVRTEKINIGGAIYLPLRDSFEPKFQILAVPALHSSSLANHNSAGNPMGFVLSFSQNHVPLSPHQVSSLKSLKDQLAEASAFSVYFACDTGYFSDMSWIGELGIDIAVLPIGDRFTMGPSVSLDAINAISPKLVIPSHYNTWEPISQKIEMWSESVKKYTHAQPCVIPNGGTLLIEDKQWRLL